MMRQILVVMAQHERALTAARTKAALKALKDRGGRVGRAPYGWAYQAGKLVAVEAEQKVIETMLRWHREGISVRRIADMLSQRGILSRKGTPWQKTQIHRCIQAEVGK
jgi:DNA invertase Pin-like site-specific DNA recombinase